MHTVSQQRDRGLEGTLRTSQAAVPWRGHKDWRIVSVMLLWSVWFGRCAQLRSRLWCGAHTAVCYLSHCCVVSIDGEVWHRYWKKEKQQQSLVKVELKVVGKHPTGDVRKVRTDEFCTAYQSPRVILRAVRGWKVKAECWWSQSSRKSYVTWSKSQRTESWKRRGEGPGVNPGELQWRWRARKTASLLCSLCKFLSMIWKKKEQIKQK